MAEIYRSDIVRVDLDHALLRKHVGAILVTGDKLGNRFGAEIFRDGKPVDVTGCGVTAYFMRPGEDAIVLNGTASGSVAYVDLAQACYSKASSFTLTIKISYGGSTTALRVIDGYILLTQTDDLVDPGDAVPTLDDLLAQIEAMEQGTADARNVVEEYEGKVAEQNASIAALTEDKVDKTGIGQVLPWNIEGIDAENVNLFSTARIYGERGYPYAEGGKLYWQNDSREVYSTKVGYIIPVKQNTVYSFSYCRWHALLADDRETLLENGLVSEDMQLDVDSGSASYIVFVTDTLTFPAADYKVSIGAGSCNLPMKVNKLPDWWLKDFDMRKLNGIAKLVNWNNLLLTEDPVEGKYYYNDEGVNPEYSYFVVRVESGKTYKIPIGCRFISNGTEGIVSNADLTAEVEYTATYSGDLYVTLVNAVRSQWAFYPIEADGQNVGTYDVPALIPSIDAKIEQAKGYASIGGNMTSGETLALPLNNLKKNNVYSFTCKVTNLTELLIGHGKTAYSSTYLRITPTNADRVLFEGSAAVEQHTHGLAIAGDLNVLIMVGVGNAKVVITSGGMSYSFETAWSGDSAAQPFAECVNGTLTDCRFTWASGDFRKPIWAFGDSYFGMTTPNRWCYYLVQHGYIGNVLLNSYPGEDTPAAKTALFSLIENYGKPKMILWCLGMNDGSDPDGSTTSRDWKPGIDAVLSLCKEYGITPIFATIPSVPTISHEAKNAWVRNSGYRYVDFAAAVGANASGVWYDGMLSSDGVHPTEIGAVTLFHRAIADCPELTYDC